MRPSHSPRHPGIADRAWRALWLIALAGVLWTPGVARAGDGDDETAPAQPPVVEGPEVDPRALVTQAETLELRGRLADALKLRDQAMTAFAATLAKRATAIAAAAQHAADESADAGQRMLASSWKACADRDVATLEAERVRCEFWVTELRKPKFGIMPHVRRERGILWTHEAEINDAVERLRKLEGREKWDAAHLARQKVSILVRAKRRYIVARMDALARTLKMLERDRRLKQTDAVKIMEGQVAFWAAALKWMENRIERVTALRTAEQDPVAGHLRATMWRGLDPLGNAIGLPQSLRGSPQEREDRAKVEDARATWYEARAKAREAGGEPR